MNLWRVVFHLKLCVLVCSAEGLWDPEKWFRALCGGSRENSPLTVGEGRDRDRRRPLDLDRELLGRNRKLSSMFLCICPETISWQLFVW